MADEGGGIGRRGLLALGLALAGSGCAVFKASQVEAGYREYPNGNERCGNCLHYVSSFDACTKVRGDIDPEAWCRFWEAN